MMKHIKFSPFTYLLLSAAISVAGCNSDGDGIDGSRTLSSLTADETVELCESVQLTGAQQEGGKKFSCFLMLMLSEDGCTSETLASCMAEPAETQTDCQPPSADEVAAFAACDATVDEMRACLSASAAALETFATYTCEDAESEGLEVPNPPACESLHEACPDLFEDEQT